MSLKMYVAPKLDIEYDLLDPEEGIQPGETVEYMGEVYGSCHLSERPRETTTWDGERTGTSPGGGVVAGIGGSPPRIRGGSPVPVVSPASPVAAGRTAATATSGISGE